MAETEFANFVDPPGEFYAHLKARAESAEAQLQAEREARERAEAERDHAVEAEMKARQRSAERLARARQLEALLQEAYEDDHRGHDGPVGDLGERIYAALKGNSHD